MRAKLMLPLPAKKRRVVFLIVFLSLMLATMQCICRLEGACVGSGGSIMRSPECMNDWYGEECEEWDDMNINDANWDFHPFRSCEGLGYTERCPYDSYRWPGECN